MQRFTGGIDLSSLIENFKERMVDEFDYQKEAEYQQAFADIYTGSEVWVPRVIKARSSDLVLTSQRLNGETFEAFLKDSTQAERDAAGMSLFRFAFRSLLLHRIFHADPHPGNLLLRARDDAGEVRLGVLDFGCVQRFEAQSTQHYAALLDAAARGLGLKPAVRAAFELDADDATLDALTEIVRLVLLPISAPQPFRFTRSFATAISKSVLEMKLKLQGRLLTRRARFHSTADGLLIVCRTLFGLANLWAQLEAEGDFRAEVLSWIDEMRSAE